jgi:hypothetical protein
MSWKICIEKLCYVKILEKIRTVHRTVLKSTSRRLKTKRTKNLWKKSWESYTVFSKETVKKTAESFALCVSVSVCLCVCRMCVSLSFY